MNVTKVTTSLNPFWAKMICVIENVTRPILEVSQYFCYKCLGLKIHVTTSVAKCPDICGMSQFSGAQSQICPNFSNEILTKTLKFCNSCIINTIKTAQSKTSKNRNLFSVPSDSVVTDFSIQDYDLLNNKTF